MLRKFCHLKEGEEVTLNLSSHSQREQHLERLSFDFGSAA